MPEQAMPPAEGQLHTGIHDDVVGHARPGTEAATLALRPVLLTGLFIVVFVGASLAGLRLYYTHTVSLPLMQPPRDFPQPHLQRAPAADLAALLQAQKARLSAYAWVDRIFMGLTIISALIVVLVVGLVAIFSIRYRRGSKADRGPLPEEVPPLGSRGGASGALPSPDGQPGSRQRAASPGDR